VALTLHVVLTTAELDDGHFIVTTLGDHFSDHLGTIDHRSADFHVVTVANQQNAIESHGFASGDFQFLDLEEFTFGDFVLLATGNNYCVHGFISVEPAHPTLYRKSYWPAWLHGAGTDARAIA
jgi:hypothetical protein